MTNLTLLDEPNVPDDTQIVRSHQEWQAMLAKTHQVQSKLHQNFAQALLDDFQANGPETIEALRQVDPAKYLTLISNILPKTTNVNIDQFASTSSIAADTERLHALRALVESAVDARQPADGPDDDGRDIPGTDAGESTD